MLVLNSFAKSWGFKLDLVKGQGNDVENVSIMQTKYYAYWSILKAC